MRIGFCVPAGDILSIREAMSLAFTLWGGPYNPIIPIAADVSHARELVKAFAVDALHPLVDGQQIRNFIADHKHLPWPDANPGMDVSGFSGDVAQFLDIYHPTRGLVEKNKSGAPPRLHCRIGTRAMHLQTHSCLFRGVYGSRAFAPKLRWFCRPTLCCRSTQR